MAATPARTPETSPERSPAPTVSLGTLDKNFSAVIVDLRAPDGQVAADHLERLMELGFLPGETVRVIAKGYPSGDPIAVRIGQATFALRRFEAEWILVRAARQSGT